MMAKSAATQGRLVDLRDIVDLLRTGPKTNMEIELACFLSRRARLRLMRVLEGAGIIEKVRENPKLWQLTRKYAKGLQALEGTLQREAGGSYA